MAAVLIFWLGWQYLRSADDAQLGKAKVHIGGSELRVDVADSESERRQGLSGRDRLETNQGMLFIFDEVGKPGIWMKDMKFSIDIIWLNEAKEVVDLDMDVSPETYPRTFTPDVPVIYVLEVPAGFSATHNIKLGDRAVFEL